MGDLTTELSQPTPDLLNEMQRAYADEWFAHYNYAYVANVIKGPDSAAIAGLLGGKAAHSFERAQELAARLLELGGELPAKLGEVMENATDKPFKLPGDLDDLGGLLEAVLDAERTSMRTFERLFRMTEGRDPVTAALFLSLLRDTMRGEHELERWVGHAASNKDGT